MPTIKQIKTPDNTTYDILDANAYHINDTEVTEASKFDNNDYIPFYETKAADTIGPKKLKVSNLISRLKTLLGLGTASTKNSTTSVTQGSDDLVTSGAVWTAIDALPEPMVFKGSLGTGGTITSLPTNGTATIGDTYKVIKDGTYAGTSAKVGDTFICVTKTSSANTWTLIPSGDEPSGTVTNVAIQNGNNGITVSGGPITDTGTLTVSHADTSSQSSSTNSGRTYIQSIGLDGYGHVTSLSTATETVTNSDENVKQIADTATSWRRLALVENNNTEKSSNVFKNSSFWCCTNPIGTTSTVGKSFLTIGNNTSSGTTGNSKGYLRIYGENNKRSQITINGSVTADREVYLPNKDGTIALTDDIPTVNDAKLTINQNGTLKGEFTANQGGNGTTVNLTDTTYTFTGGTNKFSVSVNGGTASDVNITPSIENNITGSGTSGYLAKFNGNNTIASGPQLGTSTTTFLTNKGTWATPAGTYSLPVADSSNLGGVKIGYSASGKNYAVQLDANNKMYINVPWTDTSGNDKLPLSGGTLTGNLLLKKTSSQTNPDTDDPAQLMFRTTYTPSGGSAVNSSATIRAYSDRGNGSGANLVIQPGGNLFIGSGESPEAHYALYKNSGSERTFITADSDVNIQANGNNPIGNRKGLKIQTDGSLVPNVADVATNNAGSIGTSTYKWANVYATNLNGVAIGDSPKFTDTNNRKGFFGTCSTAAGTATKVVTLNNTDGWELKAGVIVGVNFTNSNSAAAPIKLNVNGSGAISISYNGNTEHTGNQTNITGLAGHTIYYMYNGTYWAFINCTANWRDTNTTYSAGTGLSLSGTTFSNSGVTGVKGNAETDYRTGQVILTPANIGALSKSGNETKTGNLTLDRQNGTTTTVGETTLFIGNNLGSGVDKNSKGAIRLYGQSGKYVTIRSVNDMDNTRSVWFRKTGSTDKYIQYEDLMTYAEIIAGTDSSSKTIAASSLNPAINAIASNKMTWNYLASSSATPGEIKIPVSSVSDYNEYKVNVILNNGYTVSFLFTPQDVTAMHQIRSGWYASSSDNCSIVIKGSTGVGTGTQYALFNVVSCKVNGSNYSTYSFECYYR